MSGQPFIYVKDQFAPQDVHDAVWQACMAKRWYFGQTSSGAGTPFWKMDLDDDDAAARLWACARPVCEERIGRPLKVLRRYANGQTYGTEGGIHRDDSRAGAYTLVYYPMKTWRAEWDGETVYQTSHGEVITAVKPVPNRAILFDSRIPHAGRPPNRSYDGLRVTVAFKLLAE